MKSVFSLSAGIQCYRNRNRLVCLGDRGNRPAQNPFDIPQAYDVFHHCFLWLIVFIKTHQKVATICFKHLRIQQDLAYRIVPGKKIAILYRFFDRGDDDLLHPLAMEGRQMNLLRMSKTCPWSDKGNISSVFTT